MITLTKDGSAIKFTFDDSQHYLTGDGVIEVPVNSLALVTDESNMATFKKAASNDIFISALYSDFGMSKSELIAWYKNNMVSAGGGSGSGSSITSGDVESMISTALEDYPTNDDLDDALEDYYTTDEIDAAMSSLTEDISAKQDVLTAGEGIDISNDVISVTGGTGGITSGEVQSMIDESVSGKVDTSAFTESEQVTATALNDLNERADTIEQVTAIALNDLNDNKQDKLVYYEEDTEGDGWAGIYIQNDDGQGNTADYSFGVGSGTVDFGAFTQYDDGEGNVTNNNSYITIEPMGLTITSEANDGEDSNTIEITPTDVTINGDAVATEDYVNDAVSGKADTTAVTASINSAVSGKQDTLVSGTNIKTINNQSLLGSGNITISGGSGGSNVVEVTQAQYDVLVSGGTVDPDALYIITDAQEINISDYAKSSAVTAEIAAAVSGKADTSAVTAISDSLTGYVQTTAITTAVTSGSTDSEIPTAKAVFDAVGQGGGGGGITIDSSFSTSSENPLQNKVISLNLTNGDGDIFNTSGKYHWGFYSVGGVSTNKGFWLDTINGETVLKKSNLTVRNLSFVETSAVTSAMTSGSTDSEIASAKCVYDTLGGLKFVQCTQAQYDSMSQGGTLDSSTIYFIISSNS